jgi:hypothetical protein
LIHKEPASAEAGFLLIQTQVKCLFLTIPCAAQVILKIQSRVPYDREPLAVVELFITVRVRKGRYSLERADLELDNLWIMWVSDNLASFLFHLLPIYLLYFNQVLTYGC